MTSNPVQSGYVLAFYRTLQEYGGTVEEAGKLSHLTLGRKLHRGI